MTTSAAQRLDAATPATRNRVVDFLRAAAITVVVFGHWTIAGVNADDGASVSAHAVLDSTPALHPITWLAQVMPIFFFVGGFSNALSWRSARGKGQPYAIWLRTRLRRLALPIVPLLIFWVLVAGIALQAGVAPAMLRHASQVALIPTWFLAAYVLVVAVAPACLRLWERFGFASVVGMLAVAAAVDTISILTHNELAGYPNYLFVWAAVHQLGYAWVDGRLAGAGRRLALSVFGMAGLLMLVGFGPYPVSMIGVAGEEINNSAPTRITMAFLGMAQIGLVLLAEARLARWLTRPRVWWATVAINTRIMTWYLWHITAMVTVIALSSMLLGGFGLHIEPMTGLWWATRPLWCAVLVAATLVFVTVFGRVEKAPPDDRPAPATWRMIAATVCVCAGLAVMAKFGVVDDQGLTWIWPLLPVVGLLAFGVVRPPRALRRPAVA